MLFLSELESGRAVVALGSIRALPVIEQVVAEVADRAATAGLELEVECTASFELPLRARMLQVVVREPGRERDPVRGHGRDLHDLLRPRARPSAA